MIKIIDLLCKWENLQNRQYIKYFFSPLYLGSSFQSNSITFNIFVKILSLSK